MKNNSSLLSSPNITNSENQLESLEFVVEGILIPVLTCLGLVGNILSITVLHSPGVDMKVNTKQDDHYETADIVRSLRIISQTDQIKLNII